MKNNEFSILNIKPQYKSENEYLEALKSEIDEMLKISGKSEEQIYEYIEKSPYYNQEMEEIYSKLHTFNALKLRNRSPS